MGCLSSPDHSEIAGNRGGAGCLYCGDRGRKRPHPQAGGRVRLGHQLAEQIKLGPLRSACGRNVGETHSSLSHIMGPISLSRSPPSWDLFDHAKVVFVEAKPSGRLQRESGKDDHDKFSLPTGSGFMEDLLKAGTRRLITDAQFDRSGPKCFSCNEMKC
jgi:hypothetical protein